MPQQRGVVIELRHRAGDRPAADHGRRKRDPRSADQSGLQRRRRHAGGRHADACAPAPQRSRHAELRRRSRSSTPASAWTRRRAGAASSRSSPPRASAAPASAWRWSTAWCSATSADIEIDSAPGGGTTVRLHLHGCAERRQRRRSRRAASEPTAAILLVIDDDPLLLKSLRDTLEVDGHTVTTADGGQAGIDAFPQRSTRAPVRRGDHRPGHALRGRPRRWPPP